MKRNTMNNSVPGIENSRERRKGNCDEKRKGKKDREGECDLVLNSKVRERSKPNFDGVEESRWSYAAVGGGIGACKC